MRVAVPAYPWIACFKFLPKDEHVLWFGAKPIDLILPHWDQQHQTEEAAGIPRECAATVLVSIFSGSVFFHIKLYIPVLKLLNLRCGDTLDRVFHVLLWTLRKVFVKC